MNQRLLIALIILAGIGSIGSVLAYSGSISAAQGNFNNVLVTGTCTGCGGEASYTTYNIAQNNTYTLAGNKMAQVLIDNNGNVISSDSSGNVYMFFFNGTQITTGYTGDNVLQPNNIESSSTGKYQASVDTSGGNVLIYKNGVLIKTIALSPSFSWSGCKIGISPDGKYLALMDKSGIFNVLEVWQGA